MIDLQNQEAEHGQQLLKTSNLIICYTRPARQGKRKAPANASASNRQLPILPARLQASTFGLYVLNCCVRYGNRWNHIGIITGLLRDFNSLKTIQKKLLWNILDFLAKLSPRPISTALLHPSRDFHLQPIYLVFLKGSY